MSDVQNSESCIPDYPEVKLIRTLGYGYIGTTYLTEDPDTHIQQVTKVEKFDGDTSLADTYGRQLAFDRDVAKQNPGVFMTIQSVKIIENSKHIQKVPKKPGFDEKVSAVVNARQHAFITNYLPVLDGTYGSVSNMLTKQQELVLIYQICRGIRAMQKAGYRHRDISARNIMFKTDQTLPNTDDKYYSWYIIDYGSVYHESFIKNSVDYYYERHRQNDMVALVLMLVKSKLYDYANKYSINIPKFYQLASKIKKHPIYKKLYEFLPESQRVGIIDDKTLVLILEIYDNYLHASLCISGKPPHNITTIQQNEKTLLLLLKHSSDVNYDNILLQIQKLL